MDIQVSHEIIYDIEDAAPIADVIDSLVATERVSKQLGGFLEGCVDGLGVESIDLSIQRVTQESPLREIFVFTLYIAHQEDLESEVSGIIEKLFGSPVPEYDTIITVSLLILMFYGADYVFRRFHRSSESVHIKAQMDSLVTELAEKTGTPEETIRSVLGDKFNGNKLRALGGAALRFFRPSKRRGNAKIRSGTKIINEETVAEVPGDVAEQEIEPDETSDYFSDVEIEIHAQDMDSVRQGWAAIVPGYVDHRVKMLILPPTSADEVYTRAKIRGDIVVIYRREDGGEYEPRMIHLVKVTS